MWYTYILLLLQTCCLCYEYKLLSQKFTSRGIISDFGDYDDDGGIDFITVHVFANREGYKSTVYVHTDVNKNAVVHQNITVTGKCVGSVATDLNADNVLDILLTMEKEEGIYYLLGLYQDQESGQLSVQWDSREEIDFPTGVDGTKSAQNSPVNPITKMHTSTSKPPITNSNVYGYTTIHPLLADINGDGMVDILVQSDSENQDQIFVWLRTKSRYIPYTLENIPYVNFDQIDGKIVNPHSSAFVDMNGDCRADLVLHVMRNNSVFLDIYLTSYADGTLVYKKYKDSISVPKNYGQISFHDLNGDGTLDVLIPHCKKAQNLPISPSEDILLYTECEINVIYNGQIPFCSKLWQNGQPNKCRHASNLCIHSDMVFTNDYSLSIAKTMGSVGMFRVSVGDFNNNGYPDLIVNLYDPGKSFSSPYEATSESDVVLVYKNLFLEGDTPKFSQPIKIFVPRDQGERIDRAVTLDLFENGIINLLVFLNDANGMITCRFYSLVNEQIGLFMKVMTRNFVLDESKLLENTFSSGFNAHGPTYKITVIDFDGNKSPKITTLRSQSAHSPLLPPFNIFGLGETNNYVEEFYLGMPTSSKAYSNMWISIIPNCSVMTIPFPLPKPNDWILKLSLSPSKKIYTILIATLTCLVVFGLMILIFDLKEKREDSEQAKGFRQKFIIN